MGGATGAPKQNKPAAYAVSSSGTVTPIRTATNTPERPISNGGPTQILLTPCH